MAELLKLLNLTSLQLLSPLEIEPCLLPWISQPKPHQLNMWGVFWNLHDEQISKLSLGNHFDQDLKEKTGATKCPFSFDFYFIC